MDDNEEQIKTAVQNKAAPRTTIWDELNEWGKELHDWQRFILYHAVRDTHLNSDRVEDAYRLFLRHAKLDMGTEEIPDLPSSITGRADLGTGGDLYLKEIKSLKNVNAIPETSKLTFDKGLTVVYGHNGTGKSGFVRILSAACFCRSKHDIFSNVFRPPPEDIPASAEFILERGNGEEGPVYFSVGDDEIKELQRICVFDSSTARIHLDQANTLGFQPVGFDVFDEMIRVIDTIEEKLKDDIRVRAKPKDFKGLFLEPGPVAEKIAKINADTDIKDLETLGTFGEAEQKRLEEIARQEIEMKSSSAEKTLRDLSKAKTDIAALKPKIKTLLSHIDENACKSVIALLEEQNIATIKAIKAGAEAVNHPNLHQTGSTEWDEFVNASRNLGQAESDSYPQTEKPCLLCHRPLDQPSVTLIKRMWAFLDDISRQAMLEMDTKINNLANSLSNLNLELLPSESRIRSDISKINPDLVASLDGISNVLTTRRNIIADALNNNSVELIPKDDITFPDELLDDAVGKIETQEKTISEKKFEEALTNLKEEHIKLRQRQALSKNINAIKHYVEDLKWVKKANTQKSALKTRFLTDKRKNLFLTHIEGDYRDRLDRECKMLDCLLPYNLETRGSAGQTLREIKVQKDYSPKEIFSEGEQRALALADFLTEVNINPASAAIILDDPVTSMDHQRGEKIAARLADEATERQVIVFTHDVVFFSFLSNYAEDKGISLEQHWIECRDGAPGHVNLGDAPSIAREYRDTTKAKKFLAKAKQASGSERVDYIKSGAGALRSTLEVIIVRHLFKSVVQRWDEQIRIGNLNKINWSHELVNEILTLQDKLSRLIEGHSNSKKFARKMPELDDLKELIDLIDSMIKKARPDRVKKN